MRKIPTDLFFFLVISQIIWPVYDSHINLYKLLANNGVFHFFIVYNHNILFRYIISGSKPATLLKACLTTGLYLTILQSSLPQCSSTLEEVMNTKT